MTESYPPGFVSKINSLLKDEADQFWAAFQDQPSRSGLRVNTLKITPEELLSQLPGKYDPLPWTENGFLIKSGDDLGKHPFHVAGLFYLQEPSAMAPAVILNPRPGELVLDLAAAPGGKATQIASLMENQGLLVANDPHPQRVVALEQNLERCGITNALTTSDTPANLAEQLGPVFDRVLIDAPCSGEGMFRSHPSEIRRWSESFQQRMIQQQNDILWHGARLVRPGGVLVYSTCTFSPDENEGRIEQLLTGRPDFNIERIPERPGFSRGKPAGVGARKELNGTIRIWPHLAPGEGHYTARLRRASETLSDQPYLPEFQINSPDRATDQAFQDFCNSLALPDQLLPPLIPGGSRLHRRGNQLHAVPQAAPDTGSIRVRSPGWKLGSLHQGEFRPSHALALGIDRKAVQSMIEFPLEGQDIVRYFRGLTFSSPGENTWLVAAVEGYPIGWARRTSGRIKSFAPRWLRQF